MKRLYGWFCLIAPLLFIGELWFSRSARTNLLITAAIVLALVGVCALMSALVRHALPDGALKDALLRLRRRAPLSSRANPPAH